MKRLLAIIPALLILIFGVSSNALASNVTDAIWSGIVRITNNSTAATGVSVNFTANTSVLISSGYMNSSGNNTAIQFSGADVAYMPGYAGNPWIVYVNSIGANTIQDDTLYTGGTTDMAAKIRYFPGINGGRVNDAAGLEPSNNFSQTVTALLPTANYSVGNFSGYTEVDFSNNITIPNGMRINSVNTSAVQDYYVYKDYTAGYFNAIDVNFEIYTVGDASANGFGAIAFANAVNDRTGFAVTDIWCGTQVQSASTLVVTLGRGDATATDTTVAIASNQTYYIRLYRAAGSDTLTAYVYTDPAHTNPVDTLTVAGVGAGTTWRYGYGFVNINSGAANRLWTGYIQNTTPTYINKDGAYNIYASDSAVNVQIMSAPTSAYTTLTKAFTAGEITFTVTQNSTTLGMQEGTGAWTTTSPKAVPNTTSNWSFLINVPYADNISMSVGGNRQLLYEPATIITSSTISDSSTDATSNPGTIVWGGNPSGVNVSFGALTSTQIITANTTSSSYIGNFMPGNVTAPYSPTLVQAQTAVQNDWLYPFIKPFATISGTPAVWFYWFGTIAIAVLGFVVAYRTKHLLISAIAFDVPFGYGIVKGYIPEWVIIVLIIWTIGAVIQEVRMG